MPRFCFILCLLYVPQLGFSQQYFEGEIVYKLETLKKDSSFDISNLKAAGASTTSCVYGHGNFIQRPDGGDLEYYYYNHIDNKLYSKYRSIDTVYFQSGEQLGASQDSIFTTRIQYNTDTILGYICNRFILQSEKLTLTLIYAPQLAVDPVYFKKTKYSYYDVIYAQTHSLFLVSIAEFDQFISKLVAQKVVRRKAGNEFPDVHRFPMEKY